MKKIIFILFILVNSCSSTQIRIRTHQQGVNKEFDSYIENYKFLIGKNNYSDEFRKLHMNFADLEGGVIGRCWWLLNGEYEIEIDYDYWFSGDFLQKEFLAYHELEHCVRKRMHTNRERDITNIIDFFEEIGFQLGIIKRKDYLNDGCPASIMHSHATSNYCRLKHKKYYYREIQEY